MTAGYHKGLERAFYLRWGVPLTFPLLLLLNLPLTPRPPSDPFFESFLTFLTFFCNFQCIFTLFSAITWGSAGPFLAIFRGGGGVGIFWDFWGHPRDFWGHFWPFFRLFCNFLGHLRDFLGHFGTIF